MFHFNIWIEDIYGKVHDVPFKPIAKAPLGSISYANQLVVLNREIERDGKPLIWMA